MDKIKILRTAKCDTRVENAVFTKDVVREDTIKHIMGVISACSFIAQKLIEQASNHDHTKLEYLDEFTESLNTHKKGEDFYKLPWWQKHLTERHHLNQRCPEDVNLIDIIEMAADIVCAGKARTGEVFPMHLSNKVLQDAFKNTIELLKDNIEVIDADISDLIDIKNDIKLTK